MPKLSNHLDADGFKVTNLAEGTDAQDAVALDQLYRMVLPSAGPVSGQHAVYVTGAGKVAHADAGTPAHAPVVGVTRHAVSAADEDVAIQFAGDMDESTWAWTPGLPVFCGASGTLTQTPPTAGFTQVVGVATGPTTLQLSLHPPIYLI